MSTKIFANNLLTFLSILTTIICFTKCENFEPIYEWSLVNYTWPNEQTYKEAIRSKTYVPENNFLGGMKMFKNKMYFTIPNVRGGTPVALVSMRLDESAKRNQLLKPFPSWKLNKKGNCFGLQNAMSLEIGTDGIMWVIDGMRTTQESSKCPPKLVLLDLNNNGKIVHTYQFPNEIVLQNGGYLNDIVLDERNGDYAYITDSSSIDPGLIIYSLKMNKAWKIRDRTMFAEISASNFTVDGVDFTNLSPINGICLSPKPKSLNADRKVYYTALVAFNIYSISTKILQNEEACKGDKWRQAVVLEGKRPDRCDGLTMDSKGGIYGALFATNGIGYWDTNKPLEEDIRTIYENKDLMSWPDTFAFDNKENLYALSNSLQKLFVTTVKLKLSPEILFRVFKANIGAKSYMYND